MKQLILNAGDAAQDIQIIPAPSQLEVMNHDGEVLQVTKQNGKAILTALNECTPIKWWCEDYGLTEDHFEFLFALTLVAGKRKQMKWYGMSKAEAQPQCWKHMKKFLARTPMHVLRRIILDLVSRRMLDRKYLKGFMGKRMALSKVRIRKAVFHHCIDTYAAEVINRVQKLQIQELIEQNSSK